MPQAGHFTNSYIKLLSNIHKAGGVPCEEHPHIFYPEDYPDPEQRHLAAKTARTLCHSCPIIEQCFEYALETKQQHGIWGGTSPGERI